MKQILSFAIAFFMSVAMFAQGALPELVYSSQPAVLKGKLVNAGANLPSTINVTATPSWSSDEMTKEVKVGADGSFEVQFDVCVTAQTSVGVGDRRGRLVYIVPGQEVSMTIDMSKLEDKTVAPIACTGALAEFNTSMANYYWDYTERNLNAEINGQGITKLRGMSMSQYKAKILDLYQTGLMKLGADPRLADSFREYLVAQYQYLTVALLNGGPKIVRYANGPDGDYTLPADYYNDVKGWNFVSTNGLAYSQGGSLETLVAQLNKEMGTDHKMAESAKQVAKAHAYFAQIEALKPLSAEALAKAKTECPAFASLIESQNKKALATVEENAKNNAFNVKEIDKALAGEDVFKAITKDYRGKMTLVDFWATWCGPCKAAMKTILPVKEELWGKVNFVYVTGETSPQALWNKMIPDIHGDHYYVTAAQWDTLLKQFGAQGIPAYVVVDKEGNVVTKHIGYPGNEVIMEELNK